MVWQIGDYITLSAVAVALGIGVASILHTRSLQKKERRERLLNEIIEWAEEIHSCNNPNFFDSWGKMMKEGWLEKDAQMKWERLRAGESEDDFEVDRQGALLSIQVNKNTSYIEARIRQCVVKANYIFTVSAGFEHDLYNSVKILIIHLNAHEKLLYTALTQPDRKKGFLQRIAAHRPYLDRNAINVIREAVKIKTKDIN